MAMPRNLCGSLMGLCLLSIGGCSDEPAQSQAGRVEITVDQRGYHPERVVGRVGEPLTLVFRRVTESGCGDQLVIPSENVEKELPLDEPVEVVVTPTEAGEIRFACGMDMYRGAVVVQAPQ